MKISIQDLTLAYRKAKVDLYYSSHPSIFKIAEYEENITQNLHDLLGKIHLQDESWVAEATFYGKWSLDPKAIKKSPTSVNEGLVFASPTDEWAAIVENKLFPDAEFRLMAHCSIDMHVLSALWMLKVGDFYDKRLSANSYGGRLRRKPNNDLDHLALGSFKPYLRPFKEWREGGIKAMQAGLASGKKIVALTADISSFYHELDPEFMLDETFMSRLGINLNENQKKLNRLFIRAIQAWTSHTPSRKGIPVGLPASAVIANLALIELDHLIEQQVAPLYYGRYVDDILLVMENGGNIKSQNELWQFLIARSNGNLHWIEGEIGTRYHSPHLKTSNLQFSNDKNKVFFLSGKTGQSLISAIAQQIYLRASEWRALPNLPNSPDDVATQLLKATNHSGEHADNLRKTDALTLHRASFALNLRDFEAYERDLPPETWAAYRHAFFDAVIEHVLSPIKFFELAQYLPRIVRMATSCEDFHYLQRLLNSFQGLVTSVDKNCHCKIKAAQRNEPARPDEITQKWGHLILTELCESVVSAFPPRLTKKGALAWDREMQYLWEKLCDKVWPGNEFSDYPLSNHKGIQKKQSLLFSLDLAHMPFRFVGLPREFISQRGIPNKKQYLASVASSEIALPKEIQKGIAILAYWLKLGKETPLGLIFATRPFGLTELYLVAKDPFEPHVLPWLDAVVLALRGFNLNDKTPLWSKYRVLHIPDGSPKKTQTIAVSSWKTELNSCVASITRNLDPDVTLRYKRLNHLINGVISQPDGAGYFVMPELSIPAHWFMRIAQKLKGRNISFISGIEYLHARKRIVRNQVWASLTHDGLGFPSLMIYKQDKQRPALHEESELFRLAGLTMKPPTYWKNNQPPIIQHGDFFFGLLICSELTNIHYRTSLRGKVDALFVVEWNQDTETFNSLVESAALDMHAYIIQCNDRQHGDSRIRAPYKDTWSRDVLRVKGGIHDYVVTGRIDVNSLRAFQSSYRSASGPFKPVPDGFEIADVRKVLPT